MLNNTLQHHISRRAEDIEHVLRERVALLPGVRDREDRPIIFVPAREVNSHPDHLRNLLTYLHDVTQDDAKSRGFTIVIDMRRGTTWEIVKPILKTFQEYFPASINCVYIVKPDKFLEKYKISTAKYKFDIQTISLEAMPKYIDFCQIIREFGGSMPYDHDEWIELRKDTERILKRIWEILKNLDRISTEMDNAEMPIDVQSSKTSIAKHQDLYPIITAVPIDEFTSEIQSLRNRVIISGHKQSVGTRNGSTMSSPNPDLLSVFPQIEQLLQNLVNQRNIVYAKWDYRKKDLDRYFQLKLFEKDAEELSKWICSQMNVLTHRFVLIGESEIETNRLLKEHKDFADSVNTYQVSYDQVITVSHRLHHQFQFLGMNKIEGISKQLQADWTRFVGMIEHRTALLQTALNMHEKSDSFLKNAEHWLSNVGVDPNFIQSEDELRSAVQRHHEFQKLYETAFSEATDEIKKLAKMLKNCFGEPAALRLPTWELVEQQSRQIMRKKRELESIWKARNVTIHSKASSPAFNQDLNSVLNWLTEHGEPFMRRKIGIGFDRTTAAQFCETHDKFRAVAHNTHRNAEEIFHAAQKIIHGSNEPMRTETIKRVEELRRRIDKFRKCIEHRTNLLCLSSNFFLHYDEIMQWYSTMDNRINYIRIVPESVHLCEQMKEKFQSENDGTVQAYERVMVEAQQLLQSLKQQRELLEVDNTEATVLVQKLTRDIENRHQHEKERWHEQRVYLNAAMKISAFLRDCVELNSQLEYWRQDLEGLRHSVTKSHEVIQQYHNENTVKVKQCVSDAMKQLEDILQLIHTKNLQLVCAVEPSQPVKDTITAAANRLYNLEQEVMQIAMDVSNQIELTIQLSNLCQTANEVIGVIERDQMSLMQLISIPRNEPELGLEVNNFHKFRLVIETTEESVKRFYVEKENLLNLPLLALELHAETRVQAENLCTVVKTKWQALVGMMESRWKLLKAADSYYKYTKMLLPTSQSIEKDLLGEGEKHFCESRNWDTLQRCIVAIQERMEKHRDHKERFMEASVYAQQTADQFIRQIRRCDAPREHMELRLVEVQKYKDIVRERQTFIFELWKSTNTQLVHCQEAAKIQLMAKEIVDWSERELAACAKIKHTVEQLNKNGLDHRAKIEELLERCLEQWDLVKVERYEMRKLLQETKHFMEKALNELHLAEIKSCYSLAQIKFKTICDMVVGCEQAVRNALSVDEANIQRRKSEQEKLSLDRFSDSTIEEKISSKEEGSNDQNGDNRKILEPMKELLKSEKDYIEDLRRCVEVYLYAYQTSGSMCPMAIRGKEREIFGNIEEIYQFHCSIFLGQLLAYAMNPEDVGYCFIEWMEKLKELYADYCLNKEENNYLICLPETIKMFNEIRERNGLEISHDLQSLVIKPVQRVTKYHILLKELLKHCNKNAKDIKNAYEIVLSIPKLANDRMHLKCFENSQDVAVGDFVMQDTFLVSEPKRYFKRERELQVFLFESNIVFTKKEELSLKKMGYVYKDSILLREFHVVEHIEGDNTKFGLRKSAFPYQNDQNTTVLKANSEAIRISWVKMLRDMKLVMDRQHKLDETSSAGTKIRSSRDSQSSLTMTLSSSATGTAQTTEDRNSAQSIDNDALLLHSAANNDQQQQHHQVVFRHEAEKNGIDEGGECKSNKQWMVTEDFTADRPEQLTVFSGQRVELLSHQGDHGEFVRVTLSPNNNATNNNTSPTAECSKATGFVPRRILVAAASQSTECDSSSGVSLHSPADEPHSLANALSAKRTSIRRFFSSNQSTSKSSSSHYHNHQHHHHQQHHHHHRPPSNPNFAPDSSLNQSSSFSFHSSAVASTSGVDLLPASSPPPVLSAVCQSSSSLSHPSSCTTATTITLHRPLPSTVATRTIDPDLPPPMNHLSSAVGTTAGAVNGDGPAQQPSTAEMDDELNNGNACPTAEEATSSSPNAANLTSTPSGEAMSSEESARLKRSYVLQELVESERTYVQDLASISDGYIASLREMELSDEDREKVKIIFANIEQILDFHKTFFLKEIEKSLHDYEAAGNSFIKYERRLHTFYVKYCQNKPKSDFLVSQDYFEQLFFDIKEKLGHKVALSDLLIKPVQRITKYQLMLSDILKYTHRSGDSAGVLERAHDIMRVVPKACDDMMQVGRLQGFQGNLSAQGRLIFQGTLFISDGGIAQPFKGKERRVFLFEQSVIIAECIPPRKEYGNPTYNFKNQIMVNKMMLDERVSDEPLRFVLQSSDPNQQATYVAQAASADDKDQWLAKLSAQLDQQKTFLNALVDPKRYQNQLANSIGVISLGGKKDSAGSLGTPTSPVPSVGGGGGTSPTKPLPASHKSSSSKLFGFGKSKS